MRVDVRDTVLVGFMLRKDQKKMEEQADKVTLEELIEKEVRVFCGLFAPVYSCVCV